MTYRPSAGKAPTVLMIPGWNGSGPSHRQSIWEQQHPEYRRVQQDDWHNARRSCWVAGIENAVRSLSGEVIVVAHSLGCIAVACWATSREGSQVRVRSAMLVAPPDLDSSYCQCQPLRSFAPVPRCRLPFASILVASETDPYSSFEAAGSLAEDWGSDLINAGNAGHINTDSGHGPWTEGATCLQRLMTAVKAEFRLTESHA